MTDANGNKSDQDKKGDDQTAPEKTAEEATNKAKTTEDKGTETKPVAEPGSNGSPNKIAELLAYRAMEKVAGNIIDEINKFDFKPDAKILLTNELDLVKQQANHLQLSEQISQVINQLDDMQTLYCRERSDGGVWKAAGDGVTGEDVPEDKKGAEKIEEGDKQPGLLDGLLDPLTKISGIVEATAKILEYFRPDIEFSGSNVSIPNHALNAMVAGQLNVDIIVENFYHLDFSNSPIISKYNHAVSKRNQLVVCKTKFITQVDTLTNEISDLDDKIKTTPEELKNQLTALQNEKKAGQETKKIIIAKMDAMIKLFDEFSALVGTVKENEKFSPLMMSAIQESLSLLKITHYLYVSVLDSGAEQFAYKVARLLFKLPIMTFIGAGVVNYFLMEAKTSKIVKSNTRMDIYAMDLKIRKDAGTLEKLKLNI